MTNDQIAAIKRDYDPGGFAIVPGYLSGEALEELRERATRLTDFLRQRQPKRADPAVRGSAPRRGRRSGDVFKGLQNHDAWFDHELKAGSHVPLIKALIDDEPVPGTAAWFTKHPGSMAEIGPHRDAIGQPPGLKPGATIWIALDSADPENGCLHYGRGSHRHEYGYGIPIPGFDVNDGTAVPANVQPGDAVIHSSLTVHWSGGNPTDRPRRAVSFFYWGASNQTPEQVDEILARWRARKEEEQRSWV
ncbi:MAG: phytanoyl-CoA dioxygenase family protein [Gammaproteobacteria bacterium]|nr:phytanoyl-CoA dioxygenase family protein [Gammaproteobacteria bacterium]